MKTLRKLFVLLFLAFAVFAGPWAWQIWTTPILNSDQTQTADAALIFGAVVRRGDISPLHRERLDTGRALLNEKKVNTLVVSNAASAARTMRDYLVAMGVAEENIELDLKAIRTPDTCRAEASRAEKRKVVFVSQKFHLPRIALQCAKYDLDAQFVAADQKNRANLGTWTTVRVRTYRWLREAALIWGIWLNLYPESEGN